MLERLIAAGVDFVFPRICPGCDARIDPSDTGAVCIDCREIPPLLQPVCRVCGCGNARMNEGGGCIDCPSGKIHFERAQGAAHYGGVARVLVEKLKYNGRLEYAPLMAEKMAEATGPEDGAPAEQFDLIVPVPLFPARRRERGFNQSEVLADELGRLLRLPVEPSVLRRVRPTSSQTRLKRRQRVRNVEGAFHAVETPQLAEKHVLLVDDVYTTGATLNACADTLRRAGAERVTCIAFARAYLP